MQNWSGETCKKCGRNQRLSWDIKDKVWYSLPEIWHNKVLCLECFLELAEEINLDLRGAINFISIVRGNSGWTIFDNRCTIRNIKGANNGSKNPS